MSDFQHCSSLSDPVSVISDPDGLVSGQYGNLAYSMSWNYHLCRQSPVSVSDMRPWKANLSL
jgi:hypothetical protein